MRDHFLCQWLSMELRDPMVNTYQLLRPLASSSIQKQNLSIWRYLKSVKTSPFHSLSSSDTALHKASPPFTKLLLAVTSALNSSTGSCGLATMRFFPTLTFMRTLWVRMPRSIQAMWNSSAPWQETMENPSRLQGTTTSRRLWILPSLLAGR